MLKSIHCPFCRLRLFDAGEGGKADIEIKCSRCGKIVKVELKEIEQKSMAVANG